MNKYYGSVKKDSIARKNASVLVTVADKNYVRQAKQLFSSAYWNAGWKGDYLLLAHEIPEKELRWFRKKGIMIYKCKPLFRKKYYGTHPRCVLNKFYLFKTYFKRWKHILYIDGDAIIRASLDALINEKDFGAVKDDTSLRQNFRKRLKCYELEEKYDFNSRGFNTGVMAFNTRIIKKETFNDMKKLILRYEPYVLWGEQPLLNIYFYKKWNHLPYMYNILATYTMGRYNLKDTQIKGIVMHYVGHRRPWHYNSAFRAEWKHNLELAEKINLQNRPHAVKRYGAIEVMSYHVYLVLKENIRIRGMLGIKDTIMYCIGLIIKSVSPQLYYYLGGQN